MDLEMTSVNQLLCPNQNPQYRKRVSLPGSLFRVITGEIPQHSLHNAQHPILSETRMRFTDARSSLILNHSNPFLVYIPMKQKFGKTDANGTVKNILSISP